MAPPTSADKAPATPTQRDCVIAIGLRAAIASGCPSRAGPVLASERAGLRSAPARRLCWRRRARRRSARACMTVVRNRGICPSRCVIDGVIVLSRNSRGSKKTMVKKPSFGRRFLHFAPQKARPVASAWRPRGLLATVHTSKRNRPKGSKMNVLKNFEAIFVITLGLACGANYLADGAGDTSSATATPAEVQTVAMAAASAPSMPVVVVAAKRMSAAEKRQSLIDEQNALTASRTAAQTI